jgi:hypothetical protein
LATEKQVQTTRQLGLGLDFESAETRPTEEQVSTEKASIKKDVKLDSGVASMKTHVEGV